MGQSASGLFGYSHTDIFPTGYMAVENCGMEPGDTVAVWGCGPAGQFTIKSAWMLGAGRVIAIDRIPEREADKIDPSFVITHRLPLDEAPGAYETFRDKEDGCIKVMLRP
jgi:threonine dehydrogenase-like Zn-dependent dehydrogenase